MIYASFCNKFYAKYAFLALFALNTIHLLTKKTIFGIFADADATQEFIAALTVADLADKALQARL